MRKKHLKTYTFAEYMADESRVTPKEKAKIELEATLIMKMIEDRKKQR